MATSDRTPPEHEPPQSWFRPVALALAMLVLGFVGGWVLRGEPDPVITIAGEPPATTPSSTTSEPAATTDGGDTTTGTTTGSGTASAPPPPPRGEVSVAVLNGTDTTGLAAQTAASLEALGYPDVATGNAPTAGGPTVVYHRAGGERGAQRVAEDLQASQISPLPADGPLATEPPESAQVVVVLGPDS